jgi:hypothetical protein
MHRQTPREFNGCFLNQVGRSLQLVKARLCGVKSPDHDNRTVLIAGQGKRC